MLLISSSKPKQLLQVRYIGHVTLEEFRRVRDEFVQQLGELARGFTLLGDFSQMDVMDDDCAPEMGRYMELVTEAGVGTVVRVVPDPGKDIGLNILSRFHYRTQPNIVTCETLAEAAEVLKI